MPGWHLCTNMSFDLVILQVTAGLGKFFLQPQSSLRDCNSACVYARCLTMGPKTHQPGRTALFPEIQYSLSEKYKRMKPGSYGTRGHCILVPWNCMTSGYCNQSEHRRLSDLRCDHMRLSTAGLGNVFAQGKRIVGTPALAGLAEHCNPRKRRIHQMAS